MGRPHPIIWRLYKQKQVSLKRRDSASKPWFRNSAQFPSCSHSCGLWQVWKLQVRPAKWKQARAEAAVRGLKFVGQSKRAGYKLWQEIHVSVIVTSVIRKSRFSYFILYHDWLDMVSLNLHINFRIFCKKPAGILTVTALTL